MSEKTNQATDWTIVSNKQNYLVVGGNLVNEVVNNVGELIDNGWTCQGGLTSVYVADSNSVWFYQAMFKLR